MKKNIIKILALTLVAVVICSVFVSCGNVISGEYYAEVGGVIGIAGTKTTYKFSGSKVTITNVTNVAGFEKETSFEGKYKIDGDQITFTFEDSDASQFNQTIPFEKTEDGIKLAGIEYKKK